MAGRGHAGRVPRTEPGDADYANDAVFAALAGRTSSRWAGWFMLGLAALVALGGVVILATFPILI